METAWSWAVTGYSHLHRRHEDICRTCRHAGLSGVEGSAELVADLGDSELEVLAAAYAADGLRFDTFHLPFERDDDIASFYETTRRRAVDKAVLWIERAGHLGVRAVIQHPTTCRHNVETDGLETFLGQLGKSLEPMLETAAACGVTVALENMLPGEDGGRLGSRPEHFERFARAFDHPNLGFRLDTHALVAGRQDAHAFPPPWGHVFRTAQQLDYGHSVCIETPPFDFGPDFTDDAWKRMVDDTMALAQQS